jgi:hypothetical protein
MTYEEKAKHETEQRGLLHDTSIQLLGMAYVADSITRGFKRLAKVIDNMSLEVQDEE